MGMVVTPKMLLCVVYDRSMVLDA